MFADNRILPGSARLGRLRAVWPWMLLGGWLGLAAAQLWALQVEAVQRGEVCSAAAQPPQWGGPTS